MGYQLNGTLFLFLLITLFAYIKYFTWGKIKRFKRLLFVVEVLYQRGGDTEGGGLKMGTEDPLCDFSYIGVCTPCI